MPRLPVFVFAVAALALAASADAQVYKWKDSKGVTHYSDSAPAAGIEYQRVQVNSNTTTAVAATPAPSASSTAAASTAKAAQPAAQPAPASTAKIPDTSANRAKLCKDLARNIGMLDSDQPLTSGDASAPQQNMSDVQRRQELATARAQKQQYCQ